MSKPETKGKAFQKSNQSLQELLHTLLTRLSHSSEIIKSWPEGGDDPSIHTQTTTKLIASIQKIVAAIKLVEERVNPNLGVDQGEKTSEQENALANQLRQTAVPLDLLDMMDADSEKGLNPDCFARGLLNEALRQFSNLRTRKASMNMLSQLVETGFEQREMKLKKIAALQEEKTKLTLSSASESASGSTQASTSAAASTATSAKEEKVKQEVDDDQEMANNRDDKDEDGLSKKRKRESSSSNDIDDTIQTDQPTKKINTNT